MTATMRNGGRPLPQPPGAFMDQEAAWYEHEERMRPSYIVSPAQQQQLQQQQQRYYGPSAVASQPPLSPSSRWAGAGAQVGSPYTGISNGPQYPFPAQPQQQGQPQQRYAYPSDLRSSSAAALSSSGRGSSSGTRPVSPVSTRATTMSLQTSGGEADASMRPRPLHLHSTPSRFQSSPVAAEGGNGRGVYQPFSLENEEARRTGVAKGSAFMHKGFFDILSLVNNQGPRPANAPATGFKATFSKATGRFRKDSNTGAGGNGRTGITMGKQDDPFFSTPAPPLQPVRRVPLQQSTNSNRAAVVSMPPSMAAYGNAPATFAAHQHPQFAGAALGPKAAKKRISVDMVGAPHVDSFVHAAHASDAEQAEEILRRWGRDNVGKIADPAWINRCKEAMRVQQARNQAEAIAQIQAALHEESAFKDNPRQLHIVNGTPSNLTTATTITPGTIGHGSLSGDSLATQRPQANAAGYFEQIAEEGGNPAPAQNGMPRTPRRVTPGGAQSPPPVALTRPAMIPRTNTQGTMLVNSPTSPAAARNNEVPDYLQFQPQTQANKLPEEAGNQRSSKVIDGMPEGFATGAGAIDALFERPISMVVRDSLQPAAATAPAPHRNLAGQELPMTLADHAGAALRPSLTTVEKSVAAKIYFENLYYGILKKPQARETRRAGLEAELALLRLPESSKEAIRNAWVANETGYLRDIRARVNVNSFSRLKTIGHGAFGVVSLCQERGTGELFAMKQLRKADMLRKGQEGHVRAERDLMTSASASANAKWIVKLVYSFQDVDHLYLIMEFMGGGDLLNLLIEKDIFAEDFARFYVAEMILAVHEAHRLGYIHRDIKPDNFLFTSQGHVKLADFGLCQSFHWAHDGAYYDQQRKNMLKKHGIDLEDSGTAARAHASRSNAMGGNATGRKGNGDGKLTEKELNDVMSDRNEDGTPLTHVLTWRERNKKKIAYSVVGTNNYMAPEVLRGLGYDQSCDWWSLGVIVFEMLYGYPPFVSKSRHLTRQKILNWRQTLRFPPKPRISREAQDFIGRLICERDDRLGSQALASVSRPNSLLQGSRQPSGFVAGTGADGKVAGAGLTDGVEELMSHPWFRGIDWNTIHTQKAPFVPALSHPADTKHFEDDIEDAPLPAPGAAEAAKNGQPIPVEQPRDPMLRDKAHGQHLLEMRKQLAFVGYTFKSPKSFDPKAQLTESKIVAAERAAAGEGAARLSRSPSQFASTGSRLRSMSM